MEELEAHYLSCDSQVLKNEFSYKGFGSGNCENAMELIKKQSELEKRAQPSSHPFGEWGKEPLNFP